MQHVNSASEIENLVIRINETGRKEYMSICDICLYVWISVCEG